MAKRKPLQSVEPHEAMLAAEKYTAPLPTPDLRKLITDFQSAYKNGAALVRIWRVMHLSGYDAIRDQLIAAMEQLANLPSD